MHAANSPHPPLVRRYLLLFRQRRILLVRDANEDVCERAEARRDERQQHAEQVRSERGLRHAEKSCNNRARGQNSVAAETSRPDAATTDTGST